MKTLLAAALVLNAQSHDETSLMQGLARRVDGKLGFDGTKKASTAKLMETATNMLKNGAGVTPDVVEFLDSAISDIENNVLGAIRHGHDLAVTEIARIVAELEAAKSTYEEHLAVHQIALDEYELANQGHKICRQTEAHKCGETHECEWELERLWREVKSQEEIMMAYHWSIHSEWCVHPPSPPHGDRVCFDSDACWHWPEADAMEGPETSQTGNHYPITGSFSEVVDFRAFSVTEFTHYSAQIHIVKEAWDRYNEQLLICRGLEIGTDGLPAISQECDDAQEVIDEAICTITSDDGAARRAFGMEWDRVTRVYDETVGACTNAQGEACDIHLLHDALLRGDDVSNFETAAVDLTCSCTGLRQEEFDRKREWETMKIVSCLLNTVHSHVVHAIDTNEPCPTTESHPEQTESDINYCHVLELSITSNLTIDYCQDAPNSLNFGYSSVGLEASNFGCSSYSPNFECSAHVIPTSDCPAPPTPPPPVAPKCSAEYVYETTGYFGALTTAAGVDFPFVQRLWGNDACVDCHSSLSDAGWGACAAPKACIPCLGQEPDLPDPGYVAPSAPCMEHELHLLHGENNKDTFRCKGSWCLPMAGRCNGVSNCGDGSDEDGCDTDWGIPAWLAQNDVCRAGAAHVPGQQDDVQFFCNDGSCTAVEGVCNGVNNCADGSDELACPENTNGVTIETSSGLQASLETITTGGSTFYDRNYEFQSVGSFTGMKYVKMSNEDKYTAHEKVQMKLRIPQPMTLYVVTTEAHGSPQTLPWLSADGWVETDFIGPEYCGVRMTPPKDWAQAGAHMAPDGTRQITALADWHFGSNLDDGLDHIDHCDERYGSGMVFEKTFPAGVVTMKGNGGGQGYLWSQGVELGHASYMVFVAHPDHPPTAPVSPIVHNFGQMFTNSCPSTAVSEADCLVAAQSLLASGQIQGRTHLVTGSWGWVPPGCSVQSHVTHGSYDFGVHFNRGFGHNDGGYTPVCADQCQHYTGTDVVAGTFEHYGADFSGAATDAACSAACTANPECTAWVRDADGGDGARCWISRQAVVTFETDGARNAGLRCN